MTAAILRTVAARSDLRHSEISSDGCANLAPRSPKSREASNTEWAQEAEKFGASAESRALARIYRISRSASAELNVIKSVQIKSSSQSIAGTLRAPKSSLLAMAVIPLPRGSQTLTPNPGSGSVVGQQSFSVGTIVLSVAKPQCPGFSPNFRRRSIIRG
jgi:hypothetical protein